MRAERQALFGSMCGTISHRRTWGLQGCHRLARGRRCQATRGQRRARGVAKGAAAVNAGLDGGAAHHLSQQAHRCGQVNRPRIKLPHRIILRGARVRSCQHFNSSASMACALCQGSTAVYCHCTLQVAANKVGAPYRQRHQLAGRAIITKVGHRAPGIQQQQQLVGRQSGGGILLVGKAEAAIVGHRAELAGITCLPACCWGACGGCACHCSGIHSFVCLRRHLPLPHLRKVRQALHVGQACAAVQPCKRIFTQQRCPSGSSDAAAVQQRIPCRRADGRWQSHFGC